MERLRGRWRGAGGVAEVLALAYPLILSQMSFTVGMFIDRLFLTWYSAEAVAGAVTGAFTTWSLIGLCIATGEYLTAFIAQYHGSGRPRRIGPAVWQGIYFSLLAGLLLAALSPLAPAVFAWAGHDPAVQRYEAAFSRICLLGGCPIVLMATLSSFFAGRGRTKVVLVANILVTAVNLLLDYLWIFGKAGFPRWGVAGAALATVTAQSCGAAFYLAIILGREHRRAFATWTGWRFERALFGRLLRYGLPAGLQYSLEILAFAFFLMIVGRIGTSPLAASGVAFNLNMIVFMPTLGLGLAVSSLVARYLGAERPEVAERATWSAFGISMSYMSLCSALYVLLPRLLLAPYAAGADPAAFAEIGPVAAVLLRFVAIYSIFDMMNVIFAAGLKGAGDTTYPLALTVFLSWTAMLLPAYLLCVRGGAGVYTAWWCASAYIFLVGLLMLRRFRAGRWKAMRVTEPALLDLPPLGASELVGP